MALFKGAVRLCKHQQHNKSQQQVISRCDTRATRLCFGCEMKITAMTKRFLQNGIARTFLKGH
jgi:hypothetical protein